MLWNCPHCRANLEASDDQITQIWAFSLCPKCLRFGLVRATQNFAVKVDRAPTGEQFIRASIAELTPIIRPAQRRSRTSTSLTKPAPQPSAAVQAAIKPQITIRIPEAPPEIPDQRPMLLPKIVMLGCLGMLAWNAFHRWVGPQDPDTTQIREVSDQVVAKAMAPVRIEPGSLIEARTNTMQIRNGPGLQFPVIGVLDLNRHYSVINVEDPWYQIQAGTQIPAWVMSDEVNPAN